MTHDAIVVGAGLSGLVCARALLRGGARAIVLEARARVGGRLWSGSLAGSIVDLGGQWMSVGQPRLAALAAELGVATFPHARAGRAILDSAGRPHGLFARIATAFAQLRAARRIMRASRAIPPGAPSDAEHAAALDAESLGDWLARTIGNGTARDRLAMHAELVFAADPADLSLLHYLSTLAATGGFRPPGPDLPGGAREHRFSGGAQQLAIRIASELGDAIRLAAPVVAIETGTPLIVRTADSADTARRVVLALPPARAHAIAAALAPAAQRFAAASKLGPVVKCFAAYDRAFWRDAGWSGEAYRPRGAVRATVALTDEHGATPSLLAFVVGEHAARWHERGPLDRRGELLASLSDQFGDAAAHPIDYVEMDWSREAWSGGCVAGLPPNVLAHGARWREPAGRIHIAGTESAVAWPGYMEGAIEAGERAAAEVLADAA